MLSLKLVFIILFIPLVCWAAYRAWSYQQHSRIVAMKTGGARLFSDHTAEQVKQVKDR